MLAHAIAVAANVDDVAVMEQPINQGGGHHFAAAANRAKSQKPTAEMTREELLERYQMQGQYGTYRVEGNKLIRKSISAANPNNEGRESTQDFRLEGDTLIVTSQNAEGQKTESRYKRLK